MKKQLLMENWIAIAGALCITMFVFGMFYLKTANPGHINEADRISAQTACDTSFFNINSPVGYTFTKGCIKDNLQVYSGDSRYLFFSVQPHFDNAASVITPNVSIKNLQNLNWNIVLNRPATLYVMTRHIPGRNQRPAWISSGYTKVTNDDLSNVAQYFKRKNDAGLIGLYDIFYRDLPAQTIALGEASDTTVSAYSMYVVALVPQPVASPSASPTASPSPSPTRSAAPTASPSPTPDALLEEAKLHYTENDCFVVYNDSVDGRHLYNITDYIRFHSGGKPSIVSGCGTDITERYNTGDPAYPEASGNAPHRHTQASNDILRIFKVR